MTRGCDTLGGCWVARELLQGGMNAPLVVFCLRSKVAQLAADMVGVDFSLVSFDFHRVQLLLHVRPKHVQLLDFQLSRL